MKVHCKTCGTEFSGPEEAVKSEVEAHVLVNHTDKETADALLVAENDALRRENAELREFLKAAQAVATTVHPIAVTEPNGGSNA